MEFEESNEAIAKSTISVTFSDKKTFEKFLAKYGSTKKAADATAHRGFSMNYGIAPDGGEVHLWATPFSYYNNHCGYSMGEWMEEIVADFSNYLIKKSQA
jgi:hypothetical protein